MWKQKMREDQKFLLIKDEQRTKACVKTLQNKYQEIEQKEECEKDWFNRIIEILCSNGRLKMQFDQNQRIIRKTPESTCMLSDKGFWT